MPQEKTKMLKSPRNAFHAQLMHLPEEERLEVARIAGRRQIKHMEPSALISLFRRKIDNMHSSYKNREKRILARVRIRGKVAEVRSKLRDVTREVLLPLERKKRLEAIARKLETIHENTRQK